jgi:hypothetical protein
MTAVQGDTARWHVEAVYGPVSPNKSYENELRFLVLLILPYILKFLLTLKADVNILKLQYPA